MLRVRHGSMLQFYNWSITSCYGNAVRSIWWGWTQDTRCSKLTAISVRPSIANTFKGKNVLLFPTGLKVFVALFGLQTCLLSPSRWKKDMAKAEGTQHFFHLASWVSNLLWKHTHKKTPYTLLYCLDWSFMRKCRNLYWVETSGPQVKLQEVKYPLDWRMNTVTAWDLYLSAQVIEIQAVPTYPADPEIYWSPWGCKFHSEHSSFLSPLLCLYHCIEQKFQWQRNFYYPLSTPHSSKTSPLPRTNKFFKSRPGCMTGYTVNHVIWGFGHSLTLKRHLTRGNGGCKKKKKKTQSGKGLEGRKIKAL